MLAAWRALPTGRASARRFGNACPPRSVLPRGLRSPASQACKLRLFGAELLGEGTCLGGCFPVTLHEDLPASISVSSPPPTSRSPSPSTHERMCENKMLERAQLRPRRGRSSGSHANAKVDVAAEGTEGGLEVGDGGDSGVSRLLVGNPAEDSVLSPSIPPAPAVVPINPRGSSFQEWAQRPER